MTIHLIHDVKEAIEIALADSACNCRHMDQPILPFISQEIFQYA
jgi:hypothetical protein